MDLIQQIPAIPLCISVQQPQEIPLNNITLQHLFSIRNISNETQTPKGPNKAMYAELFGLSKKAIDHAIKVNMHYKLSIVLKAFMADAQNKTDSLNIFNEQTIEVLNPIITQYKGYPLKRFKASVE